MPELDSTQSRSGSRSRRRLRRGRSCSTISRSTCCAAKFSASSARPGGGKSVLLRTIIGLLAKTRGRIAIFGVDRDRATPAPNCGRSSGAGASCSSRARCSPRSPCARTSSFRCGNISSCPPRLMHEIATAKLEMVGLGAEDGDKFPVRAFRRHDQARRARARARARSGDRLSRRADIGARSRSRPANSTR